MAFSVKCGADQIAQGMISRLQSAAITFAPLTAQATSRIPDERRKFCFDANGHVVGLLQAETQGAIALANIGNFSGDSSGFGYRRGSGRTGPEARREHGDFCQQT
ncbi:hypothetical protein ONZ45_g6393 [Pleurotus djamor]|nr:hypothetical protein ONZ45_g6393 [Pleurotus djamor]